MKFKRTVFLTAVVVAMGLLLGAGAASATEVVFGDPGAPNKATGILDLNIDGTLYDVTFNSLVIAAEIYGPYPGEFPFFNRRVAAGAARDAVNVALLEAGATAVGDEATDAGSTIFNIGFKSKILRIGSLKAVKVARGVREGSTWNSLGFNAWAYNLDEKTYFDK